MSKEVETQAMSLGSGVVETIISIAIGEVEGVASVGSFPSTGLRSWFGSKHSPGVDVEELEDGRLHVTCHIEVYYGYVLPDLAAQLRRSVADALASQVGIEVAAVDIYVDGIQFAA